MTLPSDNEAEIAVLGSLLLGSREALDEALGIIEPSYFLSLRHQRIYEAIVTLGSQSAPIDAITVCGALRDAGRIEEVGGDVEVFGLTAKVCTSAHFTYFLERLVEKHRKRTLVEIGDFMQREAMNGDSSWEVIEEIEGKMDALTRFGSLSTQDQKQIGIDKVRESMEARKRGDKSGAMPTGIPSFDSNLIGLKPAQYYALAGRISAGKTAMADQISLHLLKQEISILYIGLEGTSQRIIEKLASKLAQVCYFHYVKGTLSTELEGRMKRAIGLVEKMPLTLITPPDITGSQIRSLMRRHSRSHNAKVLVIDYIQKVKPHPGADGERLAIAEASAQIQRGCIETGMAALVVCQLNRESDTRERPRLSQLKGSGQIEQDADNALLLWSEKDKHDLEAGELMPVTMSLEKNKDGPSCIDHHILFDGPLMTFREVARERNQTSPHNS